MRLRFRRDAVNSVAADVAIARSATAWLARVRQRKISLARAGMWPYSLAGIHCWLRASRTGEVVGTAVAG